ncbi:hypothetical protein PM082_012054 [Marasmius tenuissimus]|nr:hypothetical protein PM082_012054 [Marasmius tenuissimus]
MEYGLSQEHLGQLHSMAYSFNDITKPLAGRPSKPWGKWHRRLRMVDGRQAVPVMKAYRKVVIDSRAAEGYLGIESKGAYRPQDDRLLCLYNPAGHAQHLLRSRDPEPRLENTREGEGGS